MTKEEIPKELLALFRTSYDQGFNDACEAMIEGFTALKDQKGQLIMTTSQVIEAIHAGKEMQKHVPHE